MQSLEFYQSEFISYLESKQLIKEPKNLYAPIDYILHLGGKRLRPVLTLVSAELFGTDYRKALPAAMAVEVFHNFSLIHDDIMDGAPLRRGKQTVHEKWDVNTGILSGDAMLVHAYQFLASYEGTVLKKLFQLFGKTAIEVCEGQQYDVDFECRNDVTIPEYLKMIEYKTAVLVAAALKMGAIVAGASPKDQDLIYEFGRNLGIAFQLQDDYLDAFGDPKTFGKQVGGDIIENKKTYLYLKSMELGTETEKNDLQALFVTPSNNSSHKVKAAKTIFENSGGVAATKKEIENYTLRAHAVLKELDIADQAHGMLKTFAENLMTRKL